MFLSEIACCSDEGSEDHSVQQKFQRQKEALRFGVRRKIDYLLDMGSFLVVRSMSESGLESNMKLVASSRQPLEVVVCLFAAMLNAILTGMEPVEHLAVAMGERKSE